MLFHLSTVPSINQTAVVLTQGRNENMNEFTNLGSVTSQRNTDKQGCLKYIFQWGPNIFQINSS